jgi:hypothetical protein
MQIEFKFDGTKSFEENFAAFLDALDGIDKEMAAILRANAPALEPVVRNGERDPSARAKFNSAIASALDALAAPKPEPEGA